MAGQSSLSHRYQILIDFLHPFLYMDLSLVFSRLREDRLMAQDDKKWEISGIHFTTAISIAGFVQRGIFINQLTRSGPAEFLFQKFN